MTKITTSALTFAALATTLTLGLACGKGSSDTSRVLANVGGDKLTEAQFQALAEAMVQDPAKAKAFLESTAPEDRMQRVQAVHGLAFQKAVIAMAKAENLDADPAVQNLLESAQAQAYLKALADRRASHQPQDQLVEPAYNYLLAKAKADHRDQGFPTLAEVKVNPTLSGQVVNAWRQNALQDEIKAKIPVTYAEDYQQ